MRRALVALAFAFALDAAADVAQQRAEQDYVLHCMGCHQRDGSGLPPDVPDFRDRVGRLVEAPGGRAYMVQVPGASQALIDDGRLAAVLNWTLAEFAPGIAVTPFEAGEVAGLRRTPPADIDALRRQLDRLLEENPDG